MSAGNESRNDFGCDARRKLRRGASVRRRVLKHMRKLLTTGAAAGGAAGLCGCADPPPPPPVQCDSPELSEGVSISAWWDQELQGFVVDATISTGAPNVSIAGMPTVAGAELRDWYLGSEGGFATLELVPSTDSTSIRVVVPVECEQTRRDVALVLDISGIPEDRTAIRVQRE